MTDGTRFTFDGQAVEHAGDATSSLLEVLRSSLDRREVPSGCAAGHCGVCTVLIDGEPRTACTTAVGDAQGTAVRTAASSDAVVARVRHEFRGIDAAQCGYCVDGIMMTVASLVGSEVAIDPPALRTALDRNLCRCGTHVRLLQAAARALGVPLDEYPGHTGPPPADEAVLEPSDQFGVCRLVQLEQAPSETAAGPRPEAEGPVPELVAAPQVEQWLRVADDGHIELLSGRSEVGQRVHRALARIAAAHLGVSPHTVRVRTVSTAESPDEGYTSGSRSMQQGGVAVAAAASAFRRLALERAASMMGVDAGQVELAAGGAQGPRSRFVPYQELVAAGPIAGAIDLSIDVPRWDAPHLGEPGVADDEVGATDDGFVHDLLLPGMVYARAVLPPTPEAQLIELETAGVRDDPEVLSLTIDGRLVLVIGTTEASADHAADRLRARAVWSDEPMALHPDPVAMMDGLERHPLVARDDVTDDDEEELPGLALRHSARFTKPFHAHASMGPSCAVAVLDDGLTVWTHTQGVYPMRREVAAVLGQPEGSITLIQARGPGCYGQNGADDAAVFAAIAANEVPGRPVQFRFSLEDELRWEPYGPAMFADASAVLGDDGSIASWRYTSVTDVHTARPRGSGASVAPAWLRAAAVERPWRGPTSGATRNIVPLYDIEAVRAVADHVRTPLRTGSLRGLGAFFNVFVIESFMDELAELAGADPIDFRLRHLADRRARDVLEAAADLAGWQQRVGPSGRGQGVALARYDDDKSYVAMVADAALDLSSDQLTVSRLAIAVDAGTVIDPDGLRQQIEGGALQGLSRTLYERLDVDRRGVNSRDWPTYPILPFSRVPQVDLTILNRRGLPPLGAGEAATPLTPAAVANAVEDASGIRLRDLPFDDASLRRRLGELEGDELDRVQAVLGRSAT